MAKSSTTTYSTSLVSSLVTSSYSQYATSLSLLPGLTITRVLFPTRTQQISTTSSVLENEMTPTSKATVQVPPISRNVYDNKINDDQSHKSSSKKTEIIIVIFLPVIMCVCLFLLYHTLKNYRTCQLNDNPVRFSELSQGANEESKQEINEESYSCETASNSVELNVDKTQCSEIFEERNGSEPDLSSSLSGCVDKSNLTADLVYQDGRVIVSSHPEHTAAIGIPSSLEDEQKKEQRKCICQGNLVGCSLPTLQPVKII